MFNIHKSHSKLELCQLIDTYFKEDIKNPKKHKKADLKKLLESHIPFIDSINIPSNNNIYYFTNLVDLKLYLINVNPKKLLTVKQKQQIQMICKRLKHYCNSNYNLNGTDYKDINEVYVDAKYIEAYGDIPTVRKVCHKLNNCYNKPCILKPKISDIVKKELEKKELYKSSKIIKCTVRHGHFIVQFD